MSPKTSISLILRVANEGDMESWEQFCAIYQPLVFRIAISRGLQPSDANDVVQEVMSRVARSVNRWDPDSSKGTFRGWIGQIAKNLIIDFIRKESRQPITSDQSDVRRLVENAATDDEQREFQYEFEKQVFLNAADKIRPKFAEATWQAFWRTAVLSENVEQVAQSLNTSPGSIYVSRSRVMAKLRKLAQQMIREEI